MDSLAQRFEEVAATLAALDVPVLWDAATQAERRALVEELVNEAAMYPDHLEVAISGAPRLNVLLSEVGLAKSRA